MRLAQRPLNPRHKAGGVIQITAAFPACNAPPSSMLTVLTDETSNLESRESFLGAFADSPRRMVQLGDDLHAHEPQS